MSQTIEAIFENGVFRPLQPVDLPESQRVTLHVPEPQPTADNGAPRGEEEETDEEFTYEPLPLRNRKTIHVTIQKVKEIGPLPIDLDEDELQALIELDELE